VALWFLGGRTLVVEPPRADYVVKRPSSSERYANLAYGSTWVWPRPTRAAECPQARRSTRGLLDHRLRFPR
jgi:hypothetical protein